jgi:hypothetical protein
VPLADSYITTDRNSSGMHARPVVGGLFIKLLADPAAWKKWSGRDRLKVGPWAPLPAPPRITEIVPTARQAPVQWRYTCDKPPEGWTLPEFDAGAWKEGPAGFGTFAPGAVVRTKWDTADIWIRREFVMPAAAAAGLKFYVFHDEDVEIYVNGIAAASGTGFTTAYVPMDVAPAALALLQPGSRITLAAHCHQTTGGQDVDIGLAEVEEAP